MDKSRRISTDGFTLVELLIVIIIIGILAAIAIPMFLGQRDKAKESAVKEGVHSIQVGVQSYAVDYNDQYPTSVNSGNLSAWVDNWPRNPWSATSAAMDDGTGQGQYSYSTPTTSSFKLIGHGKSGKDVITVP